MTGTGRCAAGRRRVSSRPTFQGRLPFVPSKHRRLQLPRIDQRRDGISDRSDVIGLEKQDRAAQPRHAQMHPPGRWYSNLCQSSAPHAASTLCIDFALGNPYLTRTIDESTTAAPPETSLPSTVSEWAETDALHVRGVLCRRVVTTLARCRRATPGAEVFVHKTGAANFSRS
jgi:hypothetical protein